MRKEERLIRLYARLPKLECKGLCYESCGPIPVFKTEAERILRVHGKHVKTTDESRHSTCAMLTDKHRCSIYEDRPLICRLFGMVERMRCPHGCEPEGGMLAERVGQQFIKEISRIDGEHPEVDGKKW